MPKHGKKYQGAASLVEAGRAYTPEEAVRLVKETSFAKFDATVELHMHLGVDPRRADQQVRGVVVLPHGTGKRTRVLVFAQGETQRIAEEAGADYAGADELIERIQGGWLEFDMSVAVPDMMSKVSRLGRILGPRGLMPSPRTGTVVPAGDIPRVVKEAHQGRVEYRVDATANIHLPIGKASFGEAELLENLAMAVDAVARAKPASAKGQYIRSIALASTMGPGIKMDVPRMLQFTVA